LKARITLPIKESNSGHGSKFVEVYGKWFCEEYLEDDKFYKLAVSILKNIFLYIDTTINNALMILYDQPRFAKAYETYLNTIQKKPYWQLFYDLSKLLLYIINSHILF